MAELNIAMNPAKLKGLIIEKYSTLSAFAVEVGISKQYLNDILKGDCNFTYKVLEKMVNCLELTNEEIRLVFFTRAV